MSYASPRPFARLQVAVLVACVTFGGGAVGTTFAGGVANAAPRRDARRAADAKHAVDAKRTADAKRATEAEARDLYKKGMTHYELGELDSAIDEFKRAYELTHAPGLLFNIAQVHRLRKDPEQALYAYRMYLRLVPAAPNRADVDALIVEMETLDKDQKAAAAAAALEAKPAPIAPPPAVAAAPSPAVVPVPAARPLPPRPRHWREKLWSGVGLAAAGLGVLAGGVALGVQATSNADDLARASQMSGTWDAINQARFRDGQRAELIGGVLDGVGAAMVATGVVLGVLGLRERAAARAFSLLPSRTGGSLVVSCVF